MHLRHHSDNVHCYESTEVKNTVGATPSPNARGQSNIYSMRSGTFLVIVLLFVIGWIPVIGYAVAGYVGGRRSGSPIRGLVSGLIGATTAASIITFVVTPMSPYFIQFFSDLEVWVTTITENSTFQQMFNTLLVSGKDFFKSIDFTINYVACMTVASFGIVGGIIADQTQKEAHVISINTYEQCTPASVNSLAVSAENKKSQSTSEIYKEEY